MTRQLSPAPHESRTTASTALQLCPSTLPRAECQQAAFSGLNRRPIEAWHMYIWQGQASFPAGLRREMSAHPTHAIMCGQTEEAPSPGVFLSYCLRKTGLRMPPDRLPSPDSSMSSPIPQNKA